MVRLFGHQFPGSQAQQAASALDARLSMLYAVGVYRKLLPNSEDCVGEIHSKSFIAIARHASRRSHALSFAFSPK